VFLALSLIVYIVVNRRVQIAAEKQLRKLWHTTNIYMHPMIHDYAKKLVDKMPGNLKVYI